MWYKITKRILFALQFTLGGYQEIIDKMVLSSDASKLEKLMETIPHKFQQDKAFWMELMQELYYPSRGRDEDARVSGTAIVCKLAPQNFIPSFLELFQRHAKNYPDYANLKYGSSAEKVFAFINISDVIRILMNDISILPKFLPALDSETKSLICTAFSIADPEASYFIEKFNKSCPDIQPLELKDPNEKELKSCRDTIVLWSLFQEINQHRLTQDQMTSMLNRRGVIEFMLAYAKEYYEGYSLEIAVLEFVKTSILLRYILKSNTYPIIQLEKLDEEVAKLLFISLSLITETDWEEVFLKHFDKKKVQKHKEALNEFHKEPIGEELATALAEIRSKTKQVEQSQETSDYKN